MLTLPSDKRFTEIENTVSFWTRNDFGIANSLLAAKYEDIWDIAKAAYNDNRGILNEYANGTRTADTDYDIKWKNALKSRLLDRLDDAAKVMIINNALNDVRNLLASMEPLKSKTVLYRTAWINEATKADGTYPYSHQYRALRLREAAVIHIKTITSASLTPYRENEFDCGFYRYEIRVPEGSPVLALDRFESHNEDGEILLPPMKCKVNKIHRDTAKKREGIIELEYIEQLPADLKTEHYLEKLMPAIK